MGLQWNHVIESIQSKDLRAITHLLEQQTNLDEKPVEWMHPMILSTKANAEENPTWDQTMNGPDKHVYWKAMKKELHTLEVENKLGRLLIVNHG
jgi:hypothetical protein